MFCKNCGSEIEDNSVICQKCGCKTITQSNSIANDSVTNNLIQAKEKSKTDYQVIGLCVSVFLYVIGFIIPSMSIVTKHFNFDNDEITLYYNWLSLSHIVVLVISKVVNVILSSPKKSAIVTICQKFFYFICVYNLIWIGIWYLYCYI